MKAIVIGSGIAGSNTALSLLNKGYVVELWDVGITENTKNNNNDSFLNIKKDFNTSSKLLIGDENLVFPEPYKQKLFEIPPLRNFVLKENEINNLFDELNNFEIYQSYNKGGLANGWGANVLPYNDSDIFKWGIDSFSFFKSQNKIFNKIPITKVSDDINSVFNIMNFGTESEIPIDFRDNYLLSNYIQNINYFTKNRIALGKARLAIKNSGSNDSCNLTGRCLWGCPKNAIYNPNNTTIKECENFKHFYYLPNRKVHSFEIKENKVYKINITKEKKIESINVDAKIFLSAGAIQSGIIFLNTLYKNNIDPKKIYMGLMDTKKVKIVYIMPRMIGKKLNFQSIQFNRLIAGLQENFLNENKYIHLELLNLNSLFFQAIINSFPLPLKLSEKVFYFLMSSLGVCTYFLPDNIEKNNKINYDIKSNKYHINYLESSEKLNLQKKINKKIKKFLFKLGAVPIKILNYKSGAAIHYAGTIPLGISDNYAVDSNGKVKFLQNLFISDSSAFPSLPSKPVSVNAASFADYVVNKNL